jgi:hypothetical protein
VLWLAAKYLHALERFQEFPALRRIVCALIAVLCISLVALGVAIRTANSHQLTDAEIWHNTVIQKKSPAKEIPDIHKLPERRYLNEQI